jgi:hypothetical protein
MLRFLSPGHSGWLGCGLAPVHQTWKAIVQVPAGISALRGVAAGAGLRSTTAPQVIGMTPIDRHDPNQRPSQAPRLGPGHRFTRALGGHGGSCSLPYRRTRSFRQQHVAPPKGARLKSFDSDAVHWYSHHELGMKRRGLGHMLLCCSAWQNRCYAATLLWHDTPSEHLYVTTANASWCMK